MSPSRPYSLYFEGPDATHVEFTLIASDSGLFGKPVKSSEVAVGPGERYEAVVDFSSYKGKTITLMNAHIDDIDEYENTNKVMKFVIGSSVSDASNNGEVPQTLNSAVMFPEQISTVAHTFEFQDGGDADWTINGIAFSDVNNRVLARPPLGMCVSQRTDVVSPLWRFTMYANTLRSDLTGTVERWRLVHDGGDGVHPVHVHLVSFQVVSRTAGDRGLQPYESAGLKDVVLLEQDETVEVLAYYGE